MPYSNSLNARAGLNYFKFSSEGGDFSLYFRGPDHNQYRLETEEKLAALVIPESIIITLPYNILRSDYAACYESDKGMLLYHTVRDMKFGLPPRPIANVIVHGYL